MRQVQRPSAPARKPALSVGPAHLAVRPAIRDWLERLDASTDPWPRPASPTRQPRRPIP
jgi:hypothetical protein